MVLDGLPLNRTVLVGGVAVCNWQSKSLLPGYRSTLGPLWIY